MPNGSTVTLSASAQANGRPPPLINIADRTRREPEEIHIIHREW